MLLAAAATFAEDCGVIVMAHACACCRTRTSRKLELFAIGTLCFPRGRNGWDHSVVDRLRDRAYLLPYKLHPAGRVTELEVPTAVVELRRGYCRHAASEVWRYLCYVPCNRPRASQPQELARDLEDAHDPFERGLS